jgi:hypothetical protein
MVAASESLEAHVSRIRRAVLARHGFEPGDAVPETVLAMPIEDAQRLAVVSAHWGIASDMPIVGRPLVFVRRVMRLTLRWYINPIVEQQNLFNQAVVRVLHELQVENESLRADVLRLSRNAGEQPSE